MKWRNRAEGLLEFLLITIVLLSGCGGGSEGTGTGAIPRTLTGTVLGQDGKPVSGAIVTVLNTGDTTTTSPTGDFLLPLPLELNQFTVEVDSGNVKGNVNIPAIDQDVTTVQVAIKVDGSKGEITAASIQVWSRIVGDCARYFANEAIIRQTERTPRLLQCIMRFYVSGDGRRLERAPGAMQVRSCNSDEWRTIAIGKTGFGVNAGVGEIEFTFIDNRRNCEYRLAAPFGATTLTPSYIAVETFTLQESR